MSSSVRGDLAETTPSSADFAKLFDHSIVRPDATREQVLDAAEVAVRLQTATLTVQPHYLRLASERLRGSGVLVGTVVGFPHGNETPSMKAYQARAVIDLGAEEIDMVMNIPALKNGEERLFREDIEGVVRVSEAVAVKVITENGYLSQEEKTRACRWIADTGARFVKTSTAYGAGGATLEDVRLMYQAVQGRCFVKAAGGIREVAEIYEYVKAGARRFGSTRTERFVDAFQALPDQVRRDLGAYLRADPVVSEVPPAP